jgi:hypothetical protein
MQIYGTMEKTVWIFYSGKRPAPGYLFTCRKPKVLRPCQAEYTLPDKWSPSVGFLSLFLPFHPTLIPESLMEVLAEAKVGKQLLKH